MASGSRRPKIPVPANYSRVRLPREVILRRIEAGAWLRREQRDAAGAASVYERRGLLEV